MDDRKKIIIMCVLFAVVLAVGAFQLKPGPPPAPPRSPAPTPNFVANTTDKQKASVEPEPSMPPLAERDPFEAPPQADDAPPTKTPANPPANSAPVSAAAKPMSGLLPTLPLAGAQLVKEPGTPGLPNSGLKGDTKPEPTMAWHVVGVVCGEHALAILADSTGTQRLVRVGSSVDPDTTLKAVDRSSATFTFRGKRLRLSLVGDQNAK